MHAGHDGFQKIDGVVFNLGFPICVFAKSLAHPSSATVSENKGESLHHVGFQSLCSCSMSCDLSCAFNITAGLHNRPDFLVRVSGHGALGFFLGQVNFLGLSEGLGAVMTVGKFGLDVLADMLNCRVAACIISLLSTVGMGGEHMFLFCGLGCGLVSTSTGVGLVVEAATTATTSPCTTPTSLVMGGIVSRSHLVGLGLAVSNGLEPRQIRLPVQCQILGLSVKYDLPVSFRL